MEDKELIQKIKKLKSIKPSQKWVSFTKNEIFNASTEPQPEPQPQPERAGKVTVIEVINVLLAPKKLAYAGLTALLVLVGTLGFAQRTVPGDFLFPLRRATERTQSVFISEEGKLKYDFDLVNRRLADLTKIAESGNKENIGTATEELQITAEETAQNLQQETKENSKALSKIASELKQYEENKQKAESLGVNVEKETKQVDQTLRRVVEREMKSLENSSLTSDQEGILEKAKTDYENGDYTNALNKILQIVE